jgi:hypothetical protein
MPLKSGPATFSLKPGPQKYRYPAAEHYLHLFKIESIIYNIYYYPESEKETACRPEAAQAP